MNAGGKAKMTIPAEVRKLMRAVADRAEGSEEFSSVDFDDSSVSARFIDEDVDAEFRLEWSATGLEVAMKTPDRWLSQSVEADLVNSGDTLEEMIDEELVELGCEEGPLPMKHFRDDERMYTFVSPVPIDVDAAGSDEAVETALACLLAYQRAFAELGDFAGGDED